jgi:hypothetical protein
MGVLPLMAVAAPMTRAVTMAPRPGEAAAKSVARPLALGPLPSVRAAAREVALMPSGPVVLSAGRAAALTAPATAGLWLARLARR